MFSFIGLTETWSDVDKEEFYYLNGYTSVNRYRKDKKGGGVSLHILQGITYTLKNDFFDSEMETVKLKLIKVFSIRVQTLSLRLYIACLILQLIPSMSVYLTCWMLFKIKKEHELCYLLGDLNINFLKDDEHRATGELLDV